MTFFTHTRVTKKTEENKSFSCLNLKWQNTFQFYLKNESTPALSVHPAVVKTEFLPI